MFYIKDCYPDKAQYLSGEMVNVIVELSGNDQQIKQLILKCNLCKLTTTLGSQLLKISLEPGKTEKIVFCLGAIKDEFGGFGVDIQVLEDEKLLQTYSTAFDVVADWRKAPRYSFLSDFQKSQQGDEKDIQNMSKFHLNLVQFYDWMYKHEDLIPDGDEFTDLMERTLSYEVVKEKVQLCHKYGMKTMAYGAIYGASNAFYEKHKDWAFYNSSGEPVSFIDVFKIMNIIPQSPWHDHIINQYYRAIDQADFDGIHMDTYGFPKTAISKLNGLDEIVHLEEFFPSLIDRTRERLDKSNKDICLIFNNVGNWPVDTVANSKQDALYIEVWKPYERYCHIQQIICQSKLLNKTKPVILAAYLKPFSEQGERERLKAQNAALLLTAAVIANGGYHLLLGENNGVLTQAYYADYSIIDDKFSRELRNYYDFLVRFQSILYDADLRDVSMTHISGDNLEYQVENCSYSTYGEGDKVWTILREKPSLKTIQLINLCGNNEDYWNAGKENPLIQSDIIIRVQVTHAPKAVYWASPDFNMGRPEVLSYELEGTNLGKQIKLKIPELIYYNLIVIE